MIGFSSREILFSAISAVIYGLGFSLFYEILAILSTSVKLLPKLLYEIVIFDKILPAPSMKKRLKEGSFGSLFAFLSIVIFFFGLLLVSYFFLDGEIRLYMLILSSASFFIFNSAFCDILRIMFWVVFDCILLVASTVIRLVLVPLKALRIIINNKNTRK